MIIYKFSVEFKKKNKTYLLVHTISFTKCILTKNFFTQNIDKFIFHMRSS